MTEKIQEKTWSCKCETNNKQLHTVTKCESCKCLHPNPFQYLLLKFPDFKFDELPKFEIGSRTGQTGYINFLDHHELSAPISKFMDVLGRPGIVFRLIETWHGKVRPRAWVVFQRFSDAANIWVNDNYSVGTHAMYDQEWDIMRQLLVNKRYTFSENCIIVVE